MSKKKRSEQPMELNEAALEATSGGTIMRRLDKDTLNTAGTRRYEWAATAENGEFITGLTFEEALAGNAGKASSKATKAMKDDGWQTVKFE